MNTVAMVALSHIIAMVDQVTAVEAVGTTFLVLALVDLLAQVRMLTAAAAPKIWLKLRNSIRIRKCWLLADC